MLIEVNIYTELNFSLINLRNMLICEVIRFVPAITCVEEYMKLD